DRPTYHRADVSNELFGNAAAPQEDLGNLAARFVNGVDANGGGPIMAHGLQAFGRAQIDFGEDSPTETGFAEVGFPQIRFVEVRPVELRPAQLRSAELRPAEVRLGELRPVEVRLV